MVPRLTPYHWWGDAWAEPSLHALDELVGLGMLSAGSAEHLINHVALGGSVVVCSSRSRIGKSTLAHSLIEHAPPARDRIYTRGNHECFSWAEAISPASTTILVNEISPHLPIYTWGSALLRCLELGRRGAQIIATAHATSADRLVNQLVTPTVGAPVQDVVALGLVVVLDYPRGRDTGLGVVTALEPLEIAA